MSLDQAAFFSLDQEVSKYHRWPDNGPPSPAHFDPMVPSSQTMKVQQSVLAEPFDPSSMFPYNSARGVPFQNVPYDFDSHSLHYSSDVMDTDASSVSKGSIYSSISSASHTDIMFDDEGSSEQSASRKQSVHSAYSQSHPGEQICPLIAGQVDKCSPELCGPSAPCLEYLQDEVVPPIEECVPMHSSPAISLDQVTDLSADFTVRRPSTQRHRQRSTNKFPVSLTETSSTTAKPQDEDKKASLRARRSSAGRSTTEPKQDASVSKQSKKSRARQAHSLVERKYRENLNAKIQELHQTLQKVQSHHSPVPLRTASLHARGPAVVGDDDADIEEDDMLEPTPAKVKKSDVLVEAMNYVHATESEMRRKDEEIERLNERVKMMESWIRNGPMDIRSLV